MDNTVDIQGLAQFESGAIILAVFIAGLVIGCVFAYGILRRRNKPDENQVREIREEFDEYKDRVDQHFSQTSEMFRDVTSQYKKLYDHMAAGAVNLGNAGLAPMPRLEMQESGEQRQESRDPEPEEQRQESRDPEKSVTPEHPQDYAEGDDQTETDAGKDEKRT